MHDNERLQMICKFMENFQFLIIDNTKCYWNKFPIEKKNAYGHFADKIVNTNKMYYYIYKHAKPI